MNTHPDTHKPTVFNNSFQKDKVSHKNTEELNLQADVSAGWCTQRQTVQGGLTLPGTVCSEV